MIRAPQSANSPASRTNSAAHGRAPVPIARPGFARAAADTKVLFRLKRVSVSGAGTLAPAIVENTYRRLIGKGVSQADLSSIAEALSDAYGTLAFTSVAPSCRRRTFGADM